MSGTTSPNVAKVAGGSGRRAFASRNRSHVLPERGKETRKTAAGRTVTFRAAGTDCRRRRAEASRRPAPRRRHRVRSLPCMGATLGPDEAGLALERAGGMQVRLDLGPARADADDAVGSRHVAHVLFLEMTCLDREDNGRRDDVLRVGGAGDKLDHVLARPQRVVGDLADRPVAAGLDDGLELTAEAREEALALGALDPDVELQEPDRLPHVEAHGDS